VIDEMVLCLSIVLLAYLLGSIPFGCLAGRVAGKDVRQHGSRNIGATNVWRVLGKPWGLAVFSADALKGFFAVRAAIWLAGNAGVGEHAESYAILAAAACVVGHSFPVWLRFKGGKGVATSAGALLGVIPIATITILLVWLGMFLTTRYVSLASIVAALALPIVVAVLVRLDRAGSVLLYFSLAMTALVVWRHRSNISRLRSGTEQRFSRE